MQQPSSNKDSQPEWFYRAPGISAVARQKFTQVPPNSNQGMKEKLNGSSKTRSNPRGCHLFWGSPILRHTQMALTSKHPRVFSTARSPGLHTVAHGRLRVGGSYPLHRCPEPTITSFWGDAAGVGQGQETRRNQTCGFFQHVQTCSSRYRKDIWSEEAHLLSL